MGEVERHHNRQTPRLQFQLPHPYYTLCRHSPGRDWAVNTGLDSALALLEPVKQEFGSPLSWADLIVLAGTTALESTMDQVTSTSIVFQKVASELHPKVRNHGEGPY